VDSYPPVPNVQSSSGVDGKSYAADYFTKVRYFPNRLDLGAITSVQSRQLFVYNCFLRKSILAQINEPDGAGITVAGQPEPTTYQALDIKLYEVTVDIDGPATIDTVIAFDWAEPTEDSMVPVVGSRIISFPYLFRADMTETLQWSTQVMVATDGTEKRVRVRNAPRQAFSIYAFIPRTEWRTADILLYGWRGNTWGVPVFHESRRLIAPTSIDSPIIQVSTAYGEFRRGALAIIFLSPIEYEIIQILEFDGTSITAGQNITRVYPTSALVAPVTPSRMTNDPVRRTTGSTVNLTAQFESTSNFTLDTSPPPVTYEGYDVIPYEQLVENDATPDVYTRQLGVVDFIPSTVRTFNKWRNTKIVRTFELFFDNPQELWEFRLWLHRRAGRLVPFWAPTQEENMRLITKSLLGSTFLIENDGQASLGISREHIVVRTRDGDDHYVRIINQLEVSEGVAVSVDPPLNFEGAEVDVIEYIGLKRLNTDRIEIVHLQDFKAVVSLPMIEIEP
jgi:hypothetical protein